MEFLESPAFTRCVADYLADDAYRSLQQAMAREPDKGDLMPGTGGFRKLRWADPRRGKGRRGGLRVIYCYFETAQQIWLMSVYDKNEAADLTPKEKRALSEAIESELDAREANRPGRKRPRRR
jgi:hypothetical protein